MTLVYGIHPVEILLNVTPGRVRGVYYVQRKPLSTKILKLVETARFHQIPVLAVSPGDAPSDLRSHQGIWAYVIPITYFTLKKWLSSQVKRDFSTLVILDRIMDPHNLGAIIRTASCLDCQGILLPKNRSAQITPTVWKTSAGAVGTLPILREANLVQSVKHLKQEGFWVYGARVEKAPPVWETMWSEKAAIIMGSEEKGIRPLLSSHCDHFVSVPMTGPVTSLNVSVAAGMILYDRVRWFMTHKGAKDDD